MKTAGQHFVSHQFLRRTSRSLPAQGKSGKNDANDAAAICEAASRPQMRFVAVKSVEQQSMLCIHRLREGFKEERNHHAPLA